MHIESVFIKNYKAWQDQTIQLPGVHTVFIGENDAGKSSVLEAIDLFFQEEAKIGNDFIIDCSKDVEIGILFCDDDGRRAFLKKLFRGKMHKGERIEPENDNWSIVDNLKYIYISANYDDPESMLKQLSKAKAESYMPKELVERIADVAKSAADEVVSGIDSDIVVVGGEKTEISASSKISIGKAIDYSIASDGIPIAGRGSGYRKNVTYAMLIGAIYDNVILGIDEIENSFSMASCENIIDVLSEHVKQLLITTHSPDMLRHKGPLQPCPLGEKPGQSLTEIIRVLGGGDNLVLLVEGRFDLPWFKKALDLLGWSNKVLLLPGGGSNAYELHECIRSSGMASVLVIDGDSKHKADVNKSIFALDRECVELYADDSILSSLFGCNPDRVKDPFFNEIQEATSLGKNDVKARLSETAPDQLKISSDFVCEIKEMLSPIID